MEQLILKHKAHARTVNIKQMTGERELEFETGKMRTVFFKFFLIFEMELISFSQTVPTGRSFWISWWLLFHASSLHRSNFCRTTLTTMSTITNTRFLSKLFPFARYRWEIIFAVMNIFLDVCSLGWHYLPAEANRPASWKHFAALYLHKSNFCSADNRSKNSAKFVRTYITKNSGSSLWFFSMWHIFFFQSLN